MDFNFDYEELVPKIMIMDGGVGDEALSGDIICTIDIEIDAILQWLEKHKYTNTIDYKGKNYKGRDSYLNLFFFKDRKVLDKFLMSMNFSKNQINEDFCLHDIIHELHSTVGRIREIKLYNPESKLEDIEKIDGMVEFINSNYYNDIYEDNIQINRLVIEIDDPDYNFREVFYT